MRNSLFAFGFLGASLASSNLQATLIEFSFSGEVTSVTNAVGEFWDPGAVVGSLIEGRLWLDTELTRPGSEIDPGLWWWDQDRAPGAMKSAFEIAGRPFETPSEYVAAIIEHGDGSTSVEYTAEEHIGVQTIDPEEGEPNWSGLYVKDQGFSEIPDGISASEETEIQLWLNGTSNFIPYQTNEFDWATLELSALTNHGGGAFRYYASGRKIDGSPSEIVFDTRAQFQLNDIVAREVNDTTPVSEPETAFILFLGLLGLITRGLWHNRISRSGGTKPKSKVSVSSFYRF